MYLALPECPIQLSGQVLGQPGQLHQIERTNCYEKEWK